MNIVFWVTERCNLNCDYCHVKKQPKTMTLETAEKAFLYFKELFSDRDFQDGELHIGFHGGEPLINFPVIKYLTEKLKREYGQKIKYFSLTTNGTIFNKEMFDYLKDSVQLSVSIDGNRETNDLKRHYIDGRSSYDETINTLEYLKRNDIFTRVRMTVNKDSVKNFADNYIFLDKRGYGIVTYAINMDENWSKEDMEQYENQLNRIMDYFLSEKPEEGKYFLYNLKESTFRCRSYCDGGVTNFHVSADGDLFPCIMALNNSEFRLGSVFDGIDTYALNRLQKINQQSVNGCENCIFQRHCASPYSELMLEALKRCLKIPARIICMSLSITTQTCEYEKSLYQICKRLNQQGKFICISENNEMEHSQPAKFNQVIGVKAYYGGRKNAWMINEQEDVQVITDGNPVFIMGKKGGFNFFKGCSKANAFFAAVVYQYQQSEDLKNMDTALERIKKEQAPKDVETQYCNSNDCRYDCTTGTTNKCNAVATGLL